MPDAEEVEILRSAQDFGRGLPLSRGAGSLTPAKRLRIYDDGACAFCQWSQAHAEHWDVNHRLEFRDYNLHAAETPFPISELSRRMHVQAADGQWHIGFFGWLAILDALPRWRWFGRLLALPPLRWVGPALYALVANNRYRIPMWPLRLLGAPPPCKPEGACRLPNAR